MDVCTKFEEIPTTLTRIERAQDERETFLMGYFINKQSNAVEILRSFTNEGDKGRGSSNRQT